MDTKQLYILHKDRDYLRKYCKNMLKQNLILQDIN